MIGHVFPSSGAVTLAVAPARRHDDTYMVLARYEDQYVVADILIRDMPAPNSWLQGEYCDDLDEALRVFSEAAGIDVERDVLRRQVERAKRNVSVGAAAH